MEGWEAFQVDTISGSCSQVFLQMMKGGKGKGTFCPIEGIAVKLLVAIQQPWRFRPRSKVRGKLQKARDLEQSKKNINDKNSTATPLVLVGRPTWMQI